MDLYEVHIPCGQKVVVICKEAGENVKVLKNGKSLLNTAEKVEKVEEVKEEVNETSEEVNETSEEANEESSSPVENNMAGGKKSRRNNARKANATRRKNQAGGKRGPNGYMKFANKIRPQILKEHPELKSDVVGVARKIGEKWRAMSDAEKAKY